MMETGKVEIDEKIKSALRMLKRTLGRKSATEFLRNKGLDISINEVDTIINAGKSNRRRYISQEAYKIIVGDAPYSNFEKDLSFVQRMIKWFVYFNDLKPKNLIPLSIELGLGAESLTYFYRHGRKQVKFREAPLDSFSRVKSCFLNWYYLQGFEREEEIAKFLEEMEELSLAFPIYSRVPREEIEILIDEIIQIHGKPLTRLWPRGYSKKNPASRKTFPFSEYHRLLTIRENFKQQFIAKVYRILHDYLRRQVLQRYRNGELEKDTEPEDGVGYVEILHKILSDEKLNYRDYIMTNGKSLATLRAWEIELLKLEGWEVREILEKRLIQLTRYNKNNYFKI